MSRSGIALALAAAALTGLAPAAAAGLQSTAGYTYQGLGPDVVEQAVGGDGVALLRSFEQSATDAAGTAYTHTVSLDFRGQAAHGRLQAYAQAQLSSTEGRPGDGTSNGGILIGGTQVRATDELHIAGLAPGSLVEFTVWAQLSASVASSSANQCGGEPYAPATAWLNLQLDGAYSPDGSGFGTSVGGCEPGAPRVSRRFEVVAGETFSLRSALDATLYLSTDSDILERQQAFGVVDAGHTAWVWFTLHDPAAQLVSAAGGLYAAPVPEPGAGLLFALGGAALTGLARRRGAPKVPGAAGPGGAQSPAH